MNERYFAFTIKSDASQAKLKRQLRRASHGVFDYVVATTETTPYQHVHILAATASPAPAIDRFYALCPPISWEKELEDRGDVARYLQYITAQGRHTDKRSGTNFLFLKDADFLANLRP